MAEGMRGCLQLSSAHSVIMNCPCTVEVKSHQLLNTFPKEASCYELPPPPTRHISELNDRTPQFTQKITAFLSSCPPLEGRRVSRLDVPVVNAQAPDKCDPGLNPSFDL